MTRRGIHVPGQREATLPIWASRLIAAERDALASRCQSASSRVCAISYEPIAGCFFNGDDPLQLMRQVPDLLAFYIEPREPFRRCPISIPMPVICAYWRFPPVATKMSCDLRPPHREDAQGYTHVCAADWYNHLLLHRYPGQHQAVGAVPSGYGDSPRTPQYACERGGRGVWRLRLQDGG